MNLDFIKLDGVQETLDREMQVNLDQITDRNEALTAMITKQRASTLHTLLSAASRFTGAKEVAVLRRTFSHSVGLYSDVYESFIRLYDQRKFHSELAFAKLTIDLASSIQTYHNEFYKLTNFRRKVRAINGPNYSEPGSTTRHEVYLLMEEAKRKRSLDMTYWQAQEGKSVQTAKTLEQLHQCGNSACLGGHIRLSEEFQRMFQFSDETASPTVIHGNNVIKPEMVVAALLEVPLWFASLMIYDSENISMDIHPLYKCQWNAVTPDHILKILDRLNAFESPEYIYGSLNN